MHKHSSGGSVARKLLRKLGVKCHLYMKKIFNISVLAGLLVVGPSLCFAKMSIEFVSKARAKELGMEIRTIQPGPNGARVELEFGTNGELKNFSRVDLEIREGEKLLVFASLREEQSKPGRVVVSFYADRANLDKVTLKVVTGVPLNMVGYELRMKDFVELEKVR